LKEIAFAVVAFRDKQASFGAYSAPVLSWRWQRNANAGPDAGGNVVDPIATWAILLGGI
jgi:hypothetical protein